MSYGYTHKLLKIYVYTLETGNLEMMNSLKICILTTTVVYIYIYRERERKRERDTYPLFKCSGHQIRIGNILSR